MTDESVKPQRMVPADHSPFGYPLHGPPNVDQLPRGAFGMAILARARYFSEARQIEAYTNLVRVKSELLTALNEQQRLFKCYVNQSEELRNLDDFRETARGRVQLELESVQKELRDIKREERLANAKVEAEVARLEFETKRYQKASLDLYIYPQSKEEPSLAEKMKRVAAELDKINSAHDELRRQKVERAGGEELLSQDDLDMIQRFEMMRDQLLVEALGEI